MSTTQATVGDLHLAQSEMEKLLEDKNKISDKYSIGNRVNNIVRTVNGTSGYWKYQEELFLKYMFAEPLCQTPETNTK